MSTSALAEFARRYLEVNPPPPASPELRLRITQIVAGPVARPAPQEAAPRRTA